MPHRRTDHRGYMHRIAQIEKKTETFSGMIIA
jgi:hypothetical protein